MQLGGGGGGVSTHKTFQRQGPSPQVRELNDLVNRALVGQITTAQDIPIPVPFQQALSGIQDLLPGMFQAFQGGGSVASRLAPGPGGVPAGFQVPTMAGGAMPSMQSFQPTAPPGFGRTQTRTEMGLPASRREAFGGELGLPTLQEVAEGPGLPPIRPSVQTKTAGQQERRLTKKISRLERRIETRGEQKQATRKREKRLVRAERGLGEVIR